MMANLLGSYDIYSDVVGDHLQSGVGEIQALGFVKVLVAEKDVQRAATIIEEFELKEKQDRASNQIDNPQKIHFGQILIGAVLGFTIAVLLIGAG